MVLSCFRHWREKKKEKTKFVNLSTDTRTIFHSIIATDDIHKLLDLLSIFGGAVLGGMFVPPPAIETGTPALGTPSLNCWTNREVPACNF